MITAVFGSMLVMRVDAVMREEFEIDAAELEMDVFEPAQLAQRMGDSEVGRPRKRRGAPFAEHMEIGDRSVRGAHVVDHDRRIGKPFAHEADCGDRVGQLVHQEDDRHRQAELGRRLPQRHRLPAHEPAGVPLKVGRLAEAQAADRVFGAQAAQGG